MYQPNYGYQGSYNLHRYLIMFLSRKPNKKAYDKPLKLIGAQLPKPPRRIQWGGKRPDFWRTVQSHCPLLLIIGPSSKFLFFLIWESLGIEIETRPHGTGREGVNNDNFEIGMRYHVEYPLWYQGTERHFITTYIIICNSAQTAPTLSIL
jgi:hypothetical protein